MKLIVIAPCLITPFYVYRGPKEKEYMASLEIRKILLNLNDDWQILAYPCPEFILLKWPRPPMSKEVMEHLGMKKVVEDVADFIGRVISEEKPEAVIFVGVKGSPTCGVFHTTSSDPKEYPYQKVREFFYLSKSERLSNYKDVIKGGKLKVVKGRGLLFDEIFKRFQEVSETYWVEIDKDNIKDGIDKFRSLINALTNEPKN
ncbi:DUF523 domain-containing protein [Pyrococcus sp. ST04]|uniref:DUF523 domain-containing protein n=1 Tax=Pyrococcus sp. ST04 TaxID=1183377 RepID=UPI0002605D3F|nr:DUF523 domain-containing protein [Pyrococcus sp. ST04]AFK22456.1 hypothetical protein Py04_0864 [Pyrococcus sp. ST04]